MSAPPLELVVIHDLGAPGGTEWAEALASWPGAVLAPDLPGHGAAPMPAGGHYEIGDAVYPVLDLLRRRPPAERAVLGIGRNGATARLLATGGRAAALVLVDGLGGPWLDVAGRDRMARAARRQILETPPAVGAPPAGEPDPRALLVPGPSDRAFLVGQLDAIEVPTLVIESPASSTPDAEDLVGHLADATLVRVPDPSPVTVAGAVLEWWDGR